MFKKSAKVTQKPATRIFTSVFVWCFVVTAFFLIDSRVSYSNDSLKDCLNTFSKKGIKEGGEAKKPDGPLIPILKTLFGQIQSQQTVRYLVWAYIHAIESGASPNANLKRLMDQLFEPEMNQSFESGNFLFAHLALRQASKNEKLRNDPAVKIYAELLKRKKAARKKGEESPLAKFARFADEMMSDPNQDPELKADFLITQVGSDRDQFYRYLKLVPEGQQDLVWKEIEKHTMRDVLRDLARQQHSSGLYKPNS